MGIFNTLQKPKNIFDILRMPFQMGQQRRERNPNPPTANFLRSPVFDLISRKFSKPLLSPRADKLGQPPTGEEERRARIQARRPYEPKIIDSLVGGIDAQPEKTPEPSPIATPEPTPIPSHITSALPYEGRPYHDLITTAFGDLANSAHDVLRYRADGGVMKGENVSYQKVIDTVNTDEQTGEPKQIFNQATQQKEDSVDRGLFRINNERFYDVLWDKRPGYRDAMYEAGIIDDKHKGAKGLTPEKVQEYWDRMNEPENNIKMAKIVYDLGGWQSWFAAPPWLLE